MVRKFLVYTLSKDLFNKAAQGEITSHDNGRNVAISDQVLFRLIDQLLSVDETVGLIAQPSNDADAFFICEDYAQCELFSKEGIKMVWVNKGGEILPDVSPVHDVELRSLSELTDLPKMLNRPTLAQCVDWWDEWDLPKNIRQHVQMVSRAAYVLAVLMRNLGYAVDPILTHRGGLLHDLDKIKTLRISGAHGEMGAEFLEDQGYPQVAEIVREHNLSSILGPEFDRRPWENKLVFFCDKLVEGERIVPFGERVAALNRRYPAYRPLIEKTEEPVWQFSEQVCSILSLTNHQALIDLLKRYQ